MSLIDDIRNHGAEMRVRLRELLLKHEYPTDTKSLLLAAYVDIAMEHHAAIWLLTEHKLNGSALALVRTVFDTMLRGLWINAVATPEQIEQASRDELDWQRIQLRSQVKHAYFSDTPDPELPDVAERFFDLFKKLWRVLNSYTHSGARQLGRRFTGDQVKPNYSDYDIAQTLNLPTVALMFLMIMFFKSMGHQQDADETETLFMHYFEQFNEPLQRLEDAANDH